jgi:hypothetical protein
MSDFYIPPPDIYARILNFAGQQVLTKGEKGSHPQYGDYTRVGQVSASTDSDDQYWSFEGEETVRLVRNKGTGKVIHAGNSREAVPIFLEEGSLEKPTSGAA